MASGVKQAGKALGNVLSFGEARVARNAARAAERMNRDLVSGVDGAQGFMQFLQPRAIRQFNESQTSFSTGVFLPQDDVRKMYGEAFGSEADDVLLDWQESFGGVLRGEYEADVLVPEMPRGLVKRDTDTGGLIVEINEDDLFSLHAVQRAAAVHGGEMRGVPLALDYDDDLIEALEDADFRHSGSVSYRVIRNEPDEEGADVEWLFDTTMDHFEFPFERELAMRIDPSARREAMENMAYEEWAQDVAIQVDPVEVEEDMGTLVAMMRAAGYDDAEVGDAIRRSRNVEQELEEQYAEELRRAKKKIEGMKYEDIESAYANATINTSQFGEVSVDVNVPEGFPGAGRMLGRIAASPTTITHEGKRVPAYQIQWAKNYLPPEMMGAGGFGKRLYGKMVQAAAEDGRMLVSDSSMSERAGWMYEAMERRGAVIIDQRKTNPDNVYWDEWEWEQGKKFKQYHTRDGSPVIQVVKLPKSLPAAFGPVAALTEEEEAFMQEGPYTGFFEDENGTYLFKGQKAFKVPTGKGATVEETAAAMLGWKGWHKSDRKVLENISTVGGDTDGWDLLYDTLDRYGYDHLFHSMEGDVTYWYDDLALYREEQDEWTIPAGNSTAVSAD